MSEFLNSSKLLLEKLHNTFKAVDAKLPFDYHKVEDNSKLPAFLKVGNLLGKGDSCYPALLPLNEVKGIAFQLNDTNREEVHLALQYYVLRILKDSPEGHVSVTVIDTKKMGSNFRQISRLKKDILTRVVADVDEVADVISKMSNKSISIIRECLTHHENLADYNERSGNIEPYRILLISDFPHGFNDLDKLENLIQTAQETGLHVFMTYAVDKQLSSSKQEKFRQILSNLYCLYEYGNPADDYYRSNVFWAEEDAFLSNITGEIAQLYEEMKHIFRERKFEACESKYSRDWQPFSSRSFNEISKILADFREQTFEIISKKICLSLDEQRKFDLLVRFQGSHLEKNQEKDYDRILKSYDLESTSSTTIQWWVKRNLSNIKGANFFTSFKEVENKNFWPIGYFLQLDRKEISINNLEKFVSELTTAEEAPEQHYWDGINIPIGKSGGKTFNFTLGFNSDNYHAIIGGQSGKGKSVLLNNIIARGIEIYDPSELRFVIIDCSGVGFYEFDDAPGIEMLCRSSDVEECLQTIQFLEAELKKRELYFKEEGASDLKSFVQKTKVPLHRIICIIDEFHILYTGKERYSSYFDSILIDKLVRVGRKFGMHLITCTQSLGGGVRRSFLDNIPLRIALGMTSDQSNGFLGPRNDAAANLERGLAVYNGQNGGLNANQVVKVNFLSSKDTKRIISLKKQQEFINPV